MHKRRGVNFSNQNWITTFIIHPLGTFHVAIYSLWRCLDFFIRVRSFYDKNTQHSLAEIQNTERMEILYWDQTVRTRFSFPSIWKTYIIISNLKAVVNVELTKSINFQFLTITWSPFKKIYQITWSPFKKIYQSVQYRDIMEIWGGPVSILCRLITHQTVIYCSDHNIHCLK